MAVKRPEIPDEDWQALLDGVPGSGFLRTWISRVITLRPGGLLGFLRVSEQYKGAPLSFDYTGVDSVMLGIECVRLHGKLTGDHLRETQFPGTESDVAGGSPAAEDPATSEHINPQEHIVQLHGTRRYFRPESGIICGSIRFTEGTLFRLRHLDATQRAAGLDALYARISTELLRENRGDEDHSFNYYLSLATLHDTIQIAGEFDLDVDEIPWENAGNRLIDDESTDYVIKNVEEFI